MSGEYIMAVKSIGLSTVNGRKPCTLEAAAKHNKRELAAELDGRGRIVADRVKLNYSLAGAGDVGGVLAVASQLMASIGTGPDKMRRDYCQAVEVVFSLPPTSRVDPAQYFAACVAWCSDRYGAGNILSADVHHDEPSNPFHAHVLIAPIQAGRWVGGALIDRTSTQAMRESFGRDVAARYGLRMGDRLTGKRKGDAVAMVLANIETHHRAVIASNLWQPLRQAIERNPAPFIASMGLVLDDHPEKKMKTMAQIFTSTGKGAKRETLYLRKPNPIGIEPAPELPNPIGIDAKVSLRSDADSNPIGIDIKVASGVVGARKPLGIKNGSNGNQSLSCVGIAFPKRSFPPDAVPDSQRHDRHDRHGRVVERDFDQPAPDIESLPAPAFARAAVVIDDDGVMRERELMPYQPDGYDAPGADW